MAINTADVRKFLDAQHAEDIARASYCACNALSEVAAVRSNIDTAFNVATCTSSTDDLKEYFRCQALLPETEHALQAARRREELAQRNHPLHYVLEGVARLAQHEIKNQKPGFTPSIERDVDTLEALIRKLADNKTNDKIARNEIDALKYIAQAVENNPLFFEDQIAQFREIVTWLEEKFEDQNSSASS